MKRILILIVLFIGLVVPVSAIKEIPVDFKCNVNRVNIEERDTAHNFQLSSEYGGWCVVKKRNHPGQKVGYGGLYIFRTPHTNENCETRFYCIDLMCTVCANKGVKSIVKKYTFWDVHCDKCGNIFNVTNGKSVTSKTKFSLLTYIVDVIDEEWIHVHNDEGFEQRNMLWGDTDY